MPDTENTPDVAALTVQLLSAYLSNNTVPSEDLAGLIKITRDALLDDGTSAEPVVEAPTYTPAVSARKSLSSPDHIISLIDGKPYKTLKRHLRTHGLTPATYRERYNLPASYPMVAPSFAAVRRAIAEKIGLGNRKADDAAPKAAAKPAKAPAAKAPAAKATPAAVTAAAEKPAAAPKPAKAAKPAAAKVATPAASGDAVAKPAPTKKAPAKKAAPKKAAPASKAKAPAVAKDAAPAAAAPAKTDATPSTEAPKASVAKKAAAPAKRRMAREPKAS